MSSKEHLESTLLTAFVAAHLDSGGDVKIKDHLWTSTYKPGEEIRDGFACLHDDKIEGSWPEACGIGGHVIATCQRYRWRWDDLIFYPKDDDRTGVPWRMLKLDMPYLRIVLLKDEAALLAITRRLASIMEKTLAEGLGIKPPEPELN